MIVENFAENSRPLKYLLLPGLDGTGELLKRFAQLALSHIHCEVIAYEKHFAELGKF